MENLEYQQHVQPVSKECLALLLQCLNTVLFYASHVDQRGACSVHVIEQLLHQLYITRPRTSTLLSNNARQHQVPRDCDAVVQTLALFHCSQ